MPSTLPLITGMEKVETIWQILVLVQDTTFLQSRHSPEQ